MRAFDVDQQAVKRQFERAAPRYDDTAILTQEILSRTMERLAYIKMTPNVIVDVGAGTGLAFEALQERFPKARLIGVDISPAMLKHASHDADRLCADAQRLPLAPHSVDLLFANFCLPYINDLNSLFNEWHRVLKPEGLLMLTTLGPDTLLELREAWSGVDTGPRVHPFYDMHDIGDKLKKSGFRDPVMDVEEITMQYKKVETLFRDLKSQGAINTMHARTRGMTTPRQLSKVKAAYEALRGEAGVPASFEVIYAQAWGGDLMGRQDENGDVRIPVHFLK